MRVCAYAISKDEEAQVERWLAATRDCDARAVVDTGSTDRTVELLRKAGVEVVERGWEPFRFDEPRNLAISLVAARADWLISPDLDECFEDGWREKLEAVVARNPTATEVKYRVQIHHGQEVTPGLEWGRKIHIPRYRWVEPVHERLVLDPPGSEHPVEAPEIVQHHYQDLRKPREEHYLRLILAHLEREPENHYLLWFALETYSRWEKDAETIELARRYLRHAPGPTDFRAFAHLKIAQARFRQSGLSLEVYSEALRAVAEAPTEPETWLYFGQVAEAAGDLPAAFYAYSREHFTGNPEIRARLNRVVARLSGAKGRDEGNDCG